MTRWKTMAKKSILKEKCSVTIKECLEWKFSRDFSRQECHFTRWMISWTTRRRRLPSHIGAPHATADSIFEKRGGRKKSRVRYLVPTLLLSLMGQRGLEKHWLLWSGLLQQIWEIKQRRVRLQLIAKSLKGKELARELIMVLAQHYNVQNNNLCAAMSDRASVNGATMRTVKVVFPKVVDVRCFSHTVDCVGNHFNIPILKRFLQLWNSLFSHSPATRLAWRERTGISMKSYSPTRWWSWWEVAQQIMLQFAEILPSVQQRLQEAGSQAATLK